MRRNKSGLVSDSVIAGAFFKAADAVVSLVTQSRIFGAVKKAFNFGAAFKQSRLYGFCGKKDSAFPLLLKTRLGFAEKCEKSAPANLLEACYYRFISMPLRTVGVYLASFGFVALLTCLTAFSSGKTDAGEKNFIFSVILIALAVMMLPIKKSVGRCISSSVFLSRFELCPLSPEPFEKSNANLPKGYSSAFFLGLLCGLFSYALESFEIFMFSCSMLGCVIFMNNPEAGLLFTVFAMPFLDTPYILFFVFVTAISFTFKYMRGKRHIKPELSDILLLFAVALIAFAGAFTADGTAHLYDAIKYIFGIILFVLIKNVIRSTKLADSCVSLMLFSAVATAVINLIVFFFDKYGFVFAAAESGGVFSLFSSFGSLGAYCCLMTPLAFSALIGTKRPKYLLLTLLLLLCTAAVGNLYALEATTLALIVVMAFYKRAFLVFLPFFHPAASVLSRILSLVIPGTFVGFAERAYTRLPVFKSALTMLGDHPLFGIGSGAFSDIYPYYAFAGSESAAVADSLLLQIAVSLGGVGLIYCIIVLIQLPQKNLSYLVSDENKDFTIFSYCAGLFGSFVAYIALGLVSYPHSDARVLLLFWACASLGGALVNSTRNDFISSDTVREYRPSCGTN